MKVAVFVLALSVAGCSLFMKTNPDNWEPRLAPTCSDRKTAPLVDSAVAGLGVVAASIGGLCQLQNNKDSTFERCINFGVIPGIAAIVAYGVPALVGWRRIGKCRSTMRKHEAWLRPEYPAAEEPPKE
jgi:hypothetical protein